MRCPYCTFSETKVIDSRLNQTGDSTRRRRVCPRCEGRFTTYERIEEVMPLVIKKDGRREPFVREKLLKVPDTNLAKPAHRFYRGFNARIGCFAACLVDLFNGVA